MAFEVDGMLKTMFTNFGVIVSSVLNLMHLNFKNNNTYLTMQFAADLMMKRPDSIASQERLLDKMTSTI
jgi:hypothetical protein